MWWQDLLWGWFNGLTGWLVVIAHLIGALTDYPLYDTSRTSSPYDIGFLIGAGSPLLGFFRRK